MPKRLRVVLAGLLLAAVSSPALAERPISGAEAARLLAGKQFMIQCVDGTQGYGVFTNQGVVNVAYRRFNASRDTPDQRDRATVRARGHEICLAWKEFDGGGDGCYPVAEQGRGHYRIGSGMRWCEIKAR
jgi:hypothetical protein